MRLFRRLLLLLFVVMLGWAAFVVIHYVGMQKSNTTQAHFDTLIILGTTPNADGTPSPDMRERVEEGVRQYRAGVAPHMIMSGSAAHSQHVEARVMAELAASEGVPSDAIVVEDKAKDTIQNIFYSNRIMQTNGWHSAEVISLPYHLPRTAMILQHYSGPLSFAWKTDAARWPPEYSWWDLAVRDVREAVYCAGLRLHGFRQSKFLPNS